MTIAIVAKNSAQAINGIPHSTGEVVVLAGAGQVAYTCPPGHRATVNVTALISQLTAAQNLRFRVAGLLQYQRGTGEVITNNPPVYIPLGVFNVEAGDTVSVTTSNVGTQGGTLILNANVLSEVPEP